MARRRLEALVMGMCLLVLFLGLVQQIGAEPSTVELTVLHINDTHGRLFPYDREVVSEQAATSEQEVVSEPEIVNVGGMARLATLVQEIRDANEGRTLLLHAGDVLSRGDDLTVYYGGEANLKVMEVMEYDAFTPGNGDFYFGVPNLLQQTSLIHFPVLMANVVTKEGGTPLFKPYAIREVAGIQVAILGLGFIRTNHPSGHALILQDPIATAKQLLPELREQADLVIALTHIGFTQDQLLAQEVPDIDIIVGGHSHTKLEEALLVPRLSGEGSVVVVQAGDYVRYLGKLDVRLERKSSGLYEVIDAQSKFLPIGDHLQEDAVVTKILRRYSEPLSEIACVSEVTLDHPAEGESSLGNFVMHALHAETSAEVVLLDRGGVQGQIDPGKLTVAQVSRIHPWRNHLLRATLTDEQLRQVLASRDMLVAGCAFQKTEEGAIIALQVHGQPADEAAEYDVLAGSYLVGTTESIRDLPWIRTQQQVATLLQQYVKRLGVIR